MTTKTNTAMCIGCFARHKPPLNAEQLCGDCVREQERIAKIKASNRIQILQARAYGADEAYQTIGVFGAGDPTDLYEQERAEVGEANGYDDPEEIPFDEPGHMYVDSDVAICSGDILEHNGRRFQVTITEITPSPACDNCSMTKAMANALSALREGEQFICCEYEINLASS